jgi:putative SOS response-associated peptidase YedK
MLDRFQVVRDAEAMSKDYGRIDFVYPHRKGGNFRPGARVGVIIESPTGLRYGHMLWGYLQGDKPPAPFVAEEALGMESPYKKAFAGRRCIIPADRFFAHRKESFHTIHYAIRSKLKTQFCFAGIYHSHLEPGGVKVNTCAIIGIPSNYFYADFGLRMPALLLPGEHINRYLEPATPFHQALRLLRFIDQDLIHMEECRESTGLDD